MDRKARPAESGAIEPEEWDGDANPCLALKGARLYTGIGRKISYTEDDGKSWSDIPASGLAGTAHMHSAVRRVRQDLLRYDERGV